MASLNEILALCKEGQAQKAYELSKADMEQQFPWAQREMGWALYYLMKDDTDTNNYQSLITHLDEFSKLDQLSLTDDTMIFENVLFKVAGFVKRYISPTGIDSPSKLSVIFSKLRSYSFEPSKGYSFLLQSFIKCDSWQEMVDFIDWWNLNNLTDDDYKPVKLENGRTIKITLAERAYIAMSKALLRKKDNDKINEFLPELDNLMNNYPEMTYPGFFYGKLLLSLGSTQAEELRVLVPFAKKKATEFWVWQLMSDVFSADQEKQLACLLRAINCRTNEEFLGRVRIKLANLYIKQGKYDLARNQIDIAMRCCLELGRRIPHEIEEWIHQSWFDATEPSDNENLDYKTITDEILGDKREEAIAVVLYVDSNTERVSMVYGLEKRMSQKLRFSVEPGMFLKLSMVINSEGKRRILRADKCMLPTDLDYAKIVEGTIKKKGEWSYAFFYYGAEQAFISPNVVNKYDVKDGENVKCLMVYNYEKKKDSWGWVVISINR